MDEGVLAFILGPTRRLSKGHQTKGKMILVTLGSLVLEANSKNLTAWASEMAQWVGTLVMKPSPVLPGTHVIEGENQLL